LREEGGWYTIETEEEGHTIGALAQALIYEQKINYVSYRIVHPLLPKMIVRFNTKTDPEKVIEKFKSEALALCETILK
jgi:DNA-directed RNA polymerase subunit L